MFYESEEKYAHKALYTSKNSSKQICGWEDNRGWTFSRIMETYFGQKLQFKDKKP